ncbi:hypothetical protein M2272_004976 [Mycobacterium frederiksbergense]|uniref:Uncharacterized protein n=1 Tax=Mycolicibacterium frederiksbergense TaxID=117567 RepID=A0ABT6L7V6_9MYCO|nr:hypothetical protein [Mycolicibacterium frederiksbergense]MDH6198317.1 hypothetical protein [Mycolicibacterium frederiksbergense]
MGSQSGGKRLAPEVVARRLCIGVADLPDIGRAWTNRDVAEAQRDRPDWLQRARKVLGVARAEEERQRKARMDAVRLRQRGFEYPVVALVASEFAHAFARVNLLEFLYGALDAPAAQTYVVDSGFDVSTYARTVEETNRDRVKRGASLSGRDTTAWADYGGFRKPGTLGDLLDAPTGNTRATYVSGAGLDAETFDDAWYDRWALEGLAHAHVLAAMTLRGDIATLETIAGVPLLDVATDVKEPFGGVAADVVSLAKEALGAWTEIDCPILDPDDVVDLEASISALPAMLLAARRLWDRTELLAATIAGLDVEQLSDG